ncbi:MAG: MarR family transcriptional regulator [Planctomycetes bacterium]|nr:MarR family transcriptional regulator [Planctomycetota bacterium]
MDSASEPESSQSLRRRITDGFEKLALALKTQVWHGASAEGLSATQAQILALLAQRGAVSGLRLSEIAEELAITPATASDAVRALDAKQLVVKGRAEFDARALAVQMTDSGAEVARRIQSLSDFLSVAVDTLSPSERTTLQLALVKLVLHLQADGRIPLARMCANCGYFRAHAHAEPEQPHQCALTDTPIGAVDVRFDCPDHRRADREAIDDNRRVLSGA